MANEHELNGRVAVRLTAEEVGSLPAASRLNRRSISDELREAINAHLVAVATALEDERPPARRGPSKDHLPITAASDARPG